MIVFIDDWFALEVFMKFRFLLFLLPFLFIACHDDDPSCPKGKVLAEGSNTCVENFCLNNPCKINQKCTVGISGPICTCISSEQKMDENGNCYYDELLNVNCSSHGHIPQGGDKCQCDAGYELLSGNKFICVPKSLSEFCNGGTCNDGLVIPYFENKPVKGVNFVITGDGYIQSELGNNGKFLKDAKKFIGYLMSREPYKTYSKYINFYIVIAQSNQKGVDIGCNNNTVESKFDTCFDNPGVSTLIRIRNRSLARRYASKINKNVHLTIIVLNENRYFAGTAREEIGMFPRSAANISEESLLLTMYHEVGHAFGGEGFNQAVRDSLWRSHPLNEVRYSPNLSLTNDLNKIKWKKFIPYFEGLGAYEGGFYRSHGVWRPMEKCVMRSQFQTPNLCPVCTETIVKRIMNIVGKDYSFDDFLYHYSNMEHSPAPNIPLNERKRLEKMVRRTMDYIKPVKINLGE